MFKTLAATAPIAIPRRTKTWSQVGSGLVNCSVGFAPSFEMVAAAAPAISRTAQETKTPSPAARPTLKELELRGR